MVEQQGPVGPQFPKSAGRARAPWVWTKRERCGGPEQPNRFLKAERQLGGLLEGPGEEPDSRLRRWGGARSCIPPWPTRSPEV